MTDRPFYRILVDEDGVVDTETTNDPLARVPDLVVYERVAGARAKLDRIYHEQPWRRPVAMQIGLAQMARREIVRNLTRVHWTDRRRFKTRLRHIAHMFPWTWRFAE